MSPLYVLSTFYNLSTHPYFKTFPGRSQISSHFFHPLHLEQAVAFYYYGIPRCCGGYYAICVDCDPNNPIFTHIDAVNTSDDGRNPPVWISSCCVPTITHDVRRLFSTPSHSMSLVFTKSSSLTKMTLVSGNHK